MKIQVKEKIQVRSSEEVVEVFQKILKKESEFDRDKEHFWLLILNSKNHIKYIELISLGTATTSLVHPREVFRFAINKGAISVLFIHNHPSGDPAPSRDDIEITQRLKQSGDILGIKILDHIIIGSEKNHFSFIDQKML